jgi:hypothetical protein
MATQFANGKIVTDGLVLCLDAADRTSYLGSGTTWFDLAGSNNGTLTNGPTFNSTNGGSIVFDGVDDYASVTNQPLITPGSMTYEIVFMPKANGNGPLGSTDLSINTAPYFYLTFDGLTLQTYNGNLGYTNIASVEINKIYHFICTRTATTEVNYLNGVLTTGRAVNTNGFNNGFGFIGGWLILGWYGQCGVYLVRIYNRVLSAQEVRQNYNAQKNRFGLS